jgi:hypothetical protein
MTGQVEQGRGEISPLAVVETDPLADARIRPLLERYCSLAGVEMVDLGPDLHELKLPPAERAHFRDRESLRLAFSMDALARDPEAEIAVLGSPFLTQLIEAIRARAARLSLGLIPPSVTADAEGVGPPAGTSGPPALTVPVRDGTARRATARLAVHPIGRLVARVVLRAGAAVEEAVVESDVFDLSTGTRVADDLAGMFQDLEAQRLEPATDAPAILGDAAPVAPRELDDLLQLLLGNLREKSAERVAARHAAAERELAAELERLDRYFASILAEKSSPEEVRTITALHERRRTEEVRRHQVSAIVHPLQLVEASVLVERVEWKLRSAQGRRAQLDAQRALAGAAGWTLACPRCGRPPTALVVCRHEHCACDACSSRCSVCAEDFCEDHGIARCRMDEQPACEEHARVCPSCRLEHCSVHEGVCAEGGHKACSACLASCGSCGRVVCNQHAEQSRPDAPKGSRLLCRTCLRYCEGGTNEPVGVDEVTQCATCGKSVCNAHQATCVVDRQVHCSTHLRRTDRSRRLVCESHRAECAHEPEAVYASDEVAPCVTCGKVACSVHSAECFEDKGRHCNTHLRPLLDTNGAYACAAHRRACHVDGQAYSLSGVAPCPVCGNDACARHRAQCGACGRQVCTADLVEQPRPTRPPRSPRPRQCSTCAQLAAITDPPDEVVTAARAVTGGAPRPGRAWRMARDQTHLVVELELGWSRRTVFTVRHGDTVPDSVVSHSLVGSKRRK